VEHSATTRSGSGRGLVKHARGRRPSGRRVPLARLRPVEGGVAGDPPPSSQKAREGDAADGDSREIDLSTFSTPLSVISYQCSVYVIPKVIQRREAKFMYGYAVSSHLVCSSLPDAPFG
jgi:hypothetical protein